MRFIHTSDWHLGQTLSGYDRTPEHQHFLMWMLRQLKSRSIDLLLISGDIFDVAYPNATSVKMFYDFLSTAKRENPDLEIVVIAGNHDSPTRISAPAELAHPLGIHMVGSLDKSSEPPLLIGTPEAPQACVIPIPFLRTSEESYLKLKAGETSLEKSILKFIESQLSKVPLNCPTFVLSHAYFVGGELSRLSEREIQRGYSEALSANAFSETCSYVALGHLHKAQKVDGRETIRYCGSPIPLSVPERLNTQVVILGECQGQRVTSTQELPIPRHRGIWVLPRKRGSYTELLDTLPGEIEACLQWDTSYQENEIDPFIQVQVDLQEPEPRLRAQVESIVSRFPVKLIGIDATKKKQEENPQEQVLQSLMDITPESVFQARLQEESLPKDTLTQLQRCFTEVVERAERDL